MATGGEQELEEKVRYPIGKARVADTYSHEQRRKSIRVITELPAQLRSLVGGLTDTQLALRYREGGWTVRQLVHHLADEHMNAFIYFKMALTEEDPVIKLYKEPAFAQTADALDADIELSLRLLTGLHGRWALLLESLTEAQFERAYVHRRGRLTLNAAVQLYEWHCLHHAAHIRNALAARA